MNTRVSHIITLQVVALLQLNIHVFSDTSCFLKDTIQLVQLCDVSYPVPGGRL